MAVAQQDLEAVEPEWTLGDRLAKARRNAGWTQQQMAELIAQAVPEMRIKKQTISNWENDTNRPRDLMRVVDEWSRLTRAPQAWILGLRSRCIIGLPAPEGQIDLPFDVPERHLVGV